MSHEATVHCFTSASFAYLDRVRVLAKTLRKFHPDWKFWLCLSDREPEGFHFDLAEEDIDEVVHIGNLGIDNLEGWIFEHNIVELCTAVKGKMLTYVLDQGAEKVVYLDPDIALFSALDEVVDLLDHNDVLLTPHQLEPDRKRSAIIDNEIGSLKYGIYNLGFVAVSNRPEGRKFASWWRDRLLDFCFDDVPGGLFTDQRWCDHVPSFFSNVHILKHPGYNVASWNLSRRIITVDDEGVIRVNADQLRFFHFTKISWVGEIMLERYSNGKVEVFELIKWYKDQLNKASTVLPDNYWAFGTYSDGSKISQDHRTIYRSDPLLQKRFPNPFAEASVGGELRTVFDQRISALS
ncbi:hypothetical protein [Methylobacterium sp. Leaf399]|uniref:hypothetical protein n=1 Tax=Methylobacterium sp. Leaf399 TaxID=1736364 RepID=UPI000A456F19|nr:hypothetical protein [Methylobacterium sp. Leaf399]